MTRHRKILVVALALVLAAGAVFLAVLPAIVRRVAVDQIAKFTGRAVTLEDVDLNLFTGRAALTGFTLAQHDGREAALEFERLDARVAILSLLTRNIRVRELALTAPTVRVARIGPAEFDFSDILARIPPADPNAPPSTRTVTLERLAVRRATLVARDLTVAPAAEWKVESLSLDAVGLTTRAGAPAATLAVTLTLNGAPVTVTDGAVTLKPVSLTARLAVERFDLATFRAYVSPTVPAAPRAGRVSVALALAFEQGGGTPKRAAVSGDVMVENLEVVQAGRTAPFVTLPQLALKIKEADLVTQTIILAAVEADRLDLRAARDAEGTIDLLALAAGPSGATTPSLKLTLEQVALRDAKFTFTDAAVAPVTTLTVTKLSARVSAVTWPSAGPARLEAAMTLPAGGRLDVKGAGTAMPLDAELTMSMRNAPIEPYAAYIPIRATFAGRFNGDSRSRVRLADGVITATSQGTSWIDGLELRAPGEATPPARVERLRLDGIDFAWPKYAKVAKVTVTRPDIRVERDPNGVINLRKLFEPETDAGTPRATTPSPKRAEFPKKFALPIALEFGTIVVEDGYARFLDKTTTPAFSETVSNLAVTLEGLSSEPGRRAKLTAQALIGGDSALDLRGEIAPLGELYADLVGELRDFTLPSVNPYAESFIAWFLRTGKLLVRVHYRLEKDQLTADNEIVVKNLTVAPSREDDEVKKKIGLPLGLIVALMTDSQNGIKFSVPISGPWSQWRVGLSDAIWAAVKNAVVNIVAAPFRAIGRLFTGKDDTVEELKVEPVTFAAASSVLAPAMERHLTQVADFLRRAPLVRFVLAPVATARDLATFKEQAVNVRLQQLQKERGLPDIAAAIAADFRERLSDVKPPETPEQQLALLRDREQIPDARVAELQGRRLEAIRDALTKVEGVPAERLTVADATASTEAADGRVDFRITN